MRLIRLYQIAWELDPNRSKFNSLAENEGKICESIYRKVFEGNVGTTDVEEIFCMFNTNPPLSFEGHSMSVSDVVGIDRGEQQVFYYCDTFGFAEIPFDSSAVNCSEQLKAVVVEGKQTPYEKYILDDENAFIKELGSAPIAVQLQANLLLYRNETQSKFIFLGLNQDNKHCALSIAQAEEIKKAFSSPEHPAQTLSSLTETFMY